MIALPLLDERGRSRGRRDAWSLLPRSGRPCSRAPQVLAAEIRHAHDSYIRRTCRGSDLGN
jgi:hypothetical protein